jgi:hypothetical protein
MRKLISALTMAAALTLLLVVPAHAQDYPPSSGGLTVSESTISPGESFTVSGEGAEPGAIVTFTLKRSSAALSGRRMLAARPGLDRLVAAVRPQAQSAVVLGRTTANADGEFSATLTIPLGTVPGVYTLTAASGGEILSVATLRIVAAGVGNLPFTGATVLPGLAVGATLIVVGGLLLLSLKRRRSAA